MDQQQQGSYLHKIPPMAFRPAHVKSRSQRQLLDWIWQMFSSKQKKKKLKGIASGISCNGS